ncbi:MAG TPA: tRNA (guanosine(46)-N7)-methyltransferase TrmB [Gemmatimonadota bacterium]|nr:tRNA (guanosine(46)-N7)-methyltransferase TrmB [Gemmatimonadota bacterium]
MPHVVLLTHSPLHELIDKVEPFVVKEGGTVWRLRDMYLNPPGAHALAECLVVADGEPSRFFIHLTQREADASVVVRPYAAPRVDPIPSVKRMVALVAEAVREAHADVEIGPSTVRDFLSDRYRHAPDPTPAGWDPLLPERGLPRPLDWLAIYGDDHPVEIEIGSGKGTFLVEAARRAPDRNFLSIEWARPYAEHVRDRVRRHDLTNVRVVRGDAARFMADHVPPGSVEVLHLYFPDPWPKKRHHKRRLVTAEFAANVARALAPGGEVRFVTDHAEYFEEATGRFAADPGLAAARVPDEGMGNITNYGRKYLAEGRSILRARYRRVSS